MPSKRSIKIKFRKSNSVIFRNKIRKTFQPVYKCRGLRTGVRFNVGAYREGRSTNIAKGNWFDDDHIINPRGTVSACWKAPGLTRDPEGDRVVWKASIIKLEFAE